MQNSIEIKNLLITAIPVSQVIEGKKIHEIVNTKEIAFILKITTAKAYKILTELEKNSIACKYGYKIKGGFEDPGNSKLKTNSLYWQIYS